MSEVTDARCMKVGGKGLFVTLSNVNGTEMTLRSVTSSGLLCVSLGHRYPPADEKNHRLEAERSL